MDNLFCRISNGLPDFFVCSLIGNIVSDGKTAVNGFLWQSWGCSRFLGFEKDSCFGEWFFYSVTEEVFSLFLKTKIEVIIDLMKIFFIYVIYFLFLNAFLTKVLSLYLHIWFFVGRFGPGRIVNRSLGNFYSRWVFRLPQLKILLSFKIIVLTVKHVFDKNPLRLYDQTNGSSYLVI